MKKFTIQEFAQILRKKYGKVYNSLSDNDLVSKYLTKHPIYLKSIQPTELAKLGMDLGGQALKKGTDYVKDKIDNLGGNSFTDSTIQSLKDKVGDYIDKVKDNASKTQQTTTAEPEKSTTPTSNDDKVVVTKYDPVTNRHEALNTRDCSSFPFTVGCINPKIGMLNDAIFGDPLSNTYGRNLYKALYSTGYFGMSGEKDGEISQTLYDRVMQNSRQQNESLDKKNIIKQTVKKVLKDHIINK